MLREVRWLHEVAGAVLQVASEAVCIGQGFTFAQAFLELGACTGAVHALDVRRVLGALELGEFISAHDESLAKRTARSECSADGLLNRFTHVCMRSCDAKLFSLLDRDSSAAAQGLGVNALGVA